MDEEMKKYLESGFETLRNNQDCFFEMLNNHLKQENSLRYFCDWWIYTYPESIFENEPKEIVEITKNIKELLKKLELSDNKID